MDIVKWLREFKLSTSDSNYNALIVNAKTEEAADEIERLRQHNAELLEGLQSSNEALKIFANNVKKTNADIDKNWAETVYPLKANNERLRQQNAELVDALEDLLRFVKNEFDPADIMVFKAQDTLAKAKGNPTAEGE